MLPAKQIADSLVFQIWHQSGWVLLLRSCYLLEKGAGAEGQHCQPADERDKKPVAAATMMKESPLTPHSNEGSGEILSNKKEDTQEGN